MSRAGTVQVKMRPVAEILAARGINPNGSVQKYLDYTVLRLSEPYVPMQSGAMRTSAILHSDIGSGEIEYTVPYSAKQYYEGAAPGTMHTGGKRGRLWFARMKADRLEDIIRSVRRRAGAK